MINSLNIDALPIFTLYLDPGTGGLIFSVIIGIVSTAYFSAISVYYKFKDFFSSSAPANLYPSSHEGKVVLFSEGEIYYSTFLPMIRAFEKKKVSFVYLTISKLDPLLSRRSSYMEAIYIGNSYSAWNYMNNLHAKSVVMTTQGLDVLQIKRSKHVREYINIIHSPTDKSNTKTYSFDHFDKVILSGHEQEKVIRQLESLRGSKRKNLPICGCLYYDYLMEEFRRRPHTVGKSILVAPSWGKNGLLSKFGMKLIQPLIDSGEEIIIRPHPQSLTVEEDMLEELKIETSKYTNVFWDLTADNFDSMMRSKVLISDVSGIIYDFAFIFEKPVITAEFTFDRLGTEANDITGTPWDHKVLEDIGYRMGEDEISTISDLVDRVVQDNSKVANIRKIRERDVVNFGDCADIVVENVIE